MKAYLKFLPALMCLVLTAFGLRAQTPLPVAQYSFTGNANDQSSYANHATVNGAVLTQDRFNYSNRALAFNGISSSARANNAPQLNTANTTISFWVKVNQLPGQGEVFILSHGGWQERWKISLPSHGKPVFTTNGTGGIKDMDTDSVSMAPGVWRHLVMVHDGTNDKIYVNGVLKNTKAAAGALNNTTKPFGMGYDPIDVTNYFNGSLDEVMVFNVALTDAQITALFTAQNSAPAIVNERVAAYALNGSGFDSSAYANHAVLKQVKNITNRFGFGNQALEFNGTTSTVKASNNQALNSPFTTISFWVKVKSLPANGESFLLSFGGWQERWKISLPSHGKPVFTTNNTSGISDMDSGDGNALPVGSWKHVVMTHDGTFDRIFLDGVKKAEKAVAGSLKNTLHPLGMGYDPIDNGSFFNGALDDVNIYNYAMSEANVTSLYTEQSTFPGVANDLVADYKLNGNGKDDSQFANHATGNAKPATSRFGLGSNAVGFTGTDSLVAANSSALQTNNTTISFWVKVNQLPAQGEVYLLSNGGWQERWKISLPSHGKPVFTTNSTAGIKDMDTDSVPLPVGAWRHVAVVHDGTSNKIFINGLLKKSISDTGALKKTGQPFGIGYNPIDGGGNFIGEMDDLRVYNKALTDAEIATLYGQQNQAPVFTGTLVAHYPMNNSGTDVTPYGNHATVNGAIPTADRFKKANKAFSFKNSNLTASNSVQINTPTTTISFWVKVNQLPAQGEVYLLSHGGWQERWKISLPSHGKPVFTTNATGGIKDMDTDSVSLAPGSWKHVVMTHDTVNDKIYVNGQLKNSKAAPGGLKNTTKPFGMGYDPIDVNNYFDGALDEVQVYNVALNASEVAALYALQNQSPVYTDTIAPTSPLNLSATVNFTNVELSWFPSYDSIGVVGYNVFKNDTLIRSTTTTSVLITGLPATTLFTFGVSAVDSSGNESAKSTLQVTTGQDQTKDTIPPSVPGNLTAQTGSNSVQLSWTASTDNRGVVAYVILQDGIVIDTVAAPSLTKFVGGLLAKTAYTFEVYAYDAAGNKSARAEITVTTLAEINTGEAGLVASYPFDDNANDVTPYANHGVIGGNPTFITRAGASGKAIKFDGDKDSVVVKNAVQLISNYVTISFWIRVDGQNIADAEAYVIDFGHWNQRWKISLPQHLKIVWTTNSKNAQFTNAISDMDSGDGNELVKNVWWYVTIVHDGTNDIIYVNGLEVKRKPAAGTLNSTARPLVFGNNPIEGGQYFNGALDNVKLYNKALTAAEITRLFNTGTTPVDEIASAELLKMVKSISPNPVTDILTVRHSFTAKESLSIRIFDFTGRQVDALNFAKNQIPGGQFTIDVNKYPPGTFLINFVRDGKSLGAMKFIKI